MSKNVVLQEVSLGSSELIPHNGAHLPALSTVLSQLQSRVVGQGLPFPRRVGTLGRTWPQE